VRGTKPESADQNSPPNSPPYTQAFLSGQISYAMHMGLGGLSVVVNTAWSLSLVTYIKHVMHISKWRLHTTLASGAAGCLC
jgi:hypothetical protein